MKWKLVLGIVFLVLIFCSVSEMKAIVNASDGDTTSPTITILSPENMTYTGRSIFLNFTITEPTSWIGYSLDAEPNATITGNITLTNLSYGAHNITIYANDTSGNIGVSDPVRFTITPNPLFAWIGFSLGITVLLIISRKNFAFAMFMGAFILGIPVLLFSEIGTAFISAFIDLATILLALAVGLIPIIGGTLKETGQMDSLVENMRIGKKAFLAVSPALLGMLPMPGGALLSAPMVEKGGKEVPPDKKCGLNVWFRHILFLVYPLSPAMIVSVKIAELDLYQVLVYLAPLFFFSTFLGYFFFLRGIQGKTNYDQGVSLKKLFPPLAVILIAPILDFLIKTFFPTFVPEAATLIGITTSLVLAVVAGGVGARNFGQIAWNSKPWDFAFIIVGMTVFLNVFTNSGIPTLIQTLQITPVILCGVIAFLLGFATGRIQTPALIIIPIFLTKFGALSPPMFALMFFSVFLGYILSPVHPCVSLSAQFFNLEIKDFLKAISPPTLIGVAVSLVLLSIIT